MATAILLPLAEIGSDVRATDAAGNLADLGAAAGVALPPVVESLTGRGRELGTGLALVGVEAVAGATRITRDCTVRAFLSYAMDAAADGDRGTLIVRGLQGSDAERILFGVELERVDSGTVRVRARWQELSGTDAVVAGATFTPPDGFFHLAVTRLWLSGTEVEVTYVVNDRIIGTETVTEGDVGNGDDGTVAIGAAGDGAGGFERFLPDGSVLDQISVENDAMTLEELRHDYRRLTIYQPWGRSLLLSYLPPGAAWTRSPTSRLIRWISAEGDVLGEALALAEQLRDAFLPDRAYGSALAAWERVTKLSPKPADTIATRRARVLGFLRMGLGYALTDIKRALEPLFGLDADDIVTHERTGERIDDFSVDDVTDGPSAMWRTIATMGIVAVDTADLRCRMQVSVVDARWQNSPPRRETYVCEQPEGSAIVIDVATPTLGQGVWACIYFRDIHGRVLVWGPMDDDGSGPVLRHAYIVDSESAYEDAADPVPSGAIFGRYIGDGQYELGVYDAGVATVLATVAGPADPRWVGFGLVSTGISSSTTAHFTNARVFDPNSRRGACWIAERDPNLGGVYDLGAAQQQIDKQGPAHAHGAAVDDPAGFKLGSGQLGVTPLMPVP